MAKSSTDSSVFDLDRIRRLVELMKEHDLREIELHEDKQKIRLLCGGAEVVTYSALPAPQQIAQSAGSSAAPSPAPAADQASVTVVKSPMVGTFYARPNPNSEAFVKVGDHVEANTTICIIEAMKTFNEIPAEVRGRIVAILVEDGDNVDFGKPLFKVDTSK